MGSETKATPLPWKIGGGANVVGADDTLVTSVPRPKGAGAAERRDANARLIVRAVNAFEPLLAVARALYVVQTRDCPWGCEGDAHWTTCPVVDAREAVRKAGSDV